MGQYDEQLKNWYANQKTDKADYGLYEKKNSDGSFSDTDRVGKVTAQATADYRSGKKTAPKSNLESNAQLILDSAPGFVRYDTKISFGSREYDKEAFERAAAKQKDWWEKTGSTHKKYGYDMSNPEDVKRASEGKYSVAYENSFGDDEYSQWLLKNGQASGGYFESRYYKEAYDSVMLERAKQEGVRNFNKAVVREVLATAADAENPTAEEIALAADRVKKSNSSFANIGIADFGEDEADGNFATLQLDDVKDEYMAMWGKRRFQESVDRRRRTEQRNARIEAAIAASGYDATMERGTGLAYDSKGQKKYETNQKKKVAATDALVAELRAEGLAKEEIRQYLAEDGRLSYDESTEKATIDAQTKAEKAAMDNSVLGSIFSDTRRGSRMGLAVESTTGYVPATALDATTSLLQKAKDAANNQKVWKDAPIAQNAEWVAANTLTDEELEEVTLIMANARESFRLQGYSEFDIDNFFRRNDLGEYLDPIAARTNYETYTLKEWGYSDSEIETILGSFTEEDWKTADKDMLLSDYVDTSTIDQIGYTMSAIPAIAAYRMAGDVVGFFDMLTAGARNSDELWGATQWLNDRAAYWTAIGTNGNHEVLSKASEYGAEIVRLLAMQGVGQLAGAAVTGVSAASKGAAWLTKAVWATESIPFVASAMGGYYTEARGQGASTADATKYALVAGAVEGLLEKLSIGEFVSGHFGSNLIGKKLMNGNTSGMVKQLFGRYGAQLADILASSVGEGLEEGASYVASSLMRQATWDADYTMTGQEFGQNFLGGLVIGGILGGLSAPANSQRYKYAMDIYNGTGSYTMNMDSLYAASYYENLPEGQRIALKEKFDSGEIVADKSTRQAAIKAEGELANMDKEIAAKHKALESAKADGENKVALAQEKIANIDQRISAYQDADLVKKARKITELLQQRQAAEKTYKTVLSEAEKKTQQAEADYIAIKSKRTEKGVELNETVANYQTAKYFNDFYGVPQKPAQNAPVDNQVAMPTTNTTASINTAENRIDTVKNGVAQTVDEEYNDIRGDINGKADGTAETEAGGNAGVSGQTVTVPYSGMAQGLPGMDRRTDYRGIGSPVKDIIRQQGATPVDLRTATDPSSFYAAISDAKRGNPHGAFVTAHDVSEYGNMKMFLSDDNGVGVAVTKDGDIVSVFKNPNISKSRKAVSSILLTAIDNGGVKLDNYNGELSRMYLAHGFIPVARTAFVDEYAPSDWNYERDGRPDIIFWRHNGDNVETVARNIGTQEMPDLKALPLMEYDEAAAYRDSLIPQTAPEPALKDLGANTPTPAELKQSKMYTNTYDKWLTDAEKAADSVENSVYAVSKESDSIAMAKERVRASIDRTGGIDEAMRDLAHGSWDAPDVDTAMLIGETLRAEAAETGDYTKLNDWKKEIQRHMTESGQAIQALAKWTRDSSIGAETALDKAVADINKQNQKRIDRGKMAPIEVNPELLAELNNTQTRAERDAVMNKIAADIGSKMPAGILDKIRAWRYLSMLGNPRTVLRNLIGNEIMSDVLWTSKDAVGAALEKVMGVDQAQRTKALAFSDEYKANKAYAATTLDDARAVLEDSSRYDTKSGIERAIDENRQIFKFKPVEKWREATDWALSKGDAVFLEKQYKRSFAQIMTARGYTPDTMTAKQRSECMSYAINEAKRSTFHDANATADALTKFENRSKFTRVVVGGAVPFKKTPANVLKRGVEFSPIGLVQGTSQMLTKVKSGEVSAAQAIDKMSSGLVGSSLFMLGYFLAKNGILTGRNDDEDKYYKSDLGYQEYALNLGDGVSSTIDWAVPASIPLFMGAELYRIMDKANGGEINNFGDLVDAVGGTLLSISDPLLELTMLQGLQESLNNAYVKNETTGDSEFSPMRFLSNAGISFASQFAPSIGGQIARTIDPVRRDTAGDPTSELGKDLDKTINKMQAKIPGLASDLQPYINVWGEQEINEHSWPVRLLEQTILPGYLDEVDMTPVDVELTRLYSVTQNPSVVPSNYPYRTLKSKDDRYVLTADEYTEFKIENGRAMYAAAEDAINSSQYSRMNDDEKASYVAKAIKDAQDDILKKYKKKYLGK